jgi:hypothetical protein
MIDGKSVVDEALLKAKAFISKNEYVFAVREERQNVTPKLDALGKPKRKKGAKKELAKKVYNEKIAGKQLTRKQAIAIIAEEVGMTPAGASTYYGNLKGLGGCKMRVNVVLDLEIVGSDDQEQVARNIVDALDQEMVEFHRTDYRPKAHVIVHNISYRRVTED